MPKSAMPVLRRALVPEVLPAVMADLPAVPEVLPAPLPDLVLPSRLPADLPAKGRAALAAALDGALPGGQRADRGELVRESVPCRWNDEEIARLRGFLRTVDDLRGRQGRVYPLEYLLALPLIAAMAGDGELDAAAEWAATAPAELLIRLGAPLDREGKPRRPDATTIGRGLAGCDQGHYDDALCAWSAARARALRPGMRKHLRIDGKAVRGAARGGRPPMLLSGTWDDGTTAAQLPVDVRKTNEVPVFRDLLKKVPDLAGAVITADQMHTQRKHARVIEAAGAHFIFTIGENQPLLFEAAGALPWESVAGEAWTVDRGHGRVDVRTIKTLPPTGRIAALFPHVRQVFLVERYSYGTDGELLGAVAVLGITSLPADQAGPADLLAYLRGHWAIEMHHALRPSRMDGMLGVGLIPAGGRAEGDMFSVTHIDGSMERGDESMFGQLLQELAHADPEHTNVAVQHESGWTLGIYLARHVILENVESDEMPRSAYLATDGDCVEAMVAVASGRIEDLNHIDWREGYSA